jgi:cytochrome c oxidase subunit 2
VGALWGSAPLHYLAGAGPRAYPVVALTWGVIVISLAVVVIISALVLFGVLRRRSPALPDMTGAPPVERGGNGLRWIAIGVAVSSVALVVSLVWTMATLAAVVRPPRPAPLRIEVTGEQWWWRIRYLSDDPSRVFSTANEIHIPAGQPVEVRLKSADVIHSFWIPAVAGKMDAIPGQTNITWLQADQPGRFRGQCTEYCGQQHAHMALWLVVDSPASFSAWRQWQTRAATAPLGGDAALGRQIVEYRCGACHRIAGTDAGGTVAPDLTHLMGRSTIAGGVLANTAANLSGWIANPQSLKPGTKMPTLYLSGPELRAVRSYLLSLR